MFEYPRRVEFRDTDCAGILHFSVYFAYMEEAEHALLRHLGTTVHRETDEGVWSWPRVAATCDYREAARFEDVITVRLGVRELGETSVVYASDFELDGRTIADGTITCVHCLIRPGEPPRKQPIPESLREKLARFRISDPS